MSCSLVKGVVLQTIVDRIYFSWEAPCVLKGDVLIFLDCQDTTYTFLTKIGVLSRPINHDCIERWFKHV